MAIKTGNASISEKGTIRGAAGDQTGKEVYIRTWYRHSKGWVTLRFKDRRLAEYAAEAMEIICRDDDVGYDQIQNQDLWNLLEENGFDVRNINKLTETDCARLVRVCVQYACIKAGLNIKIPDFYTATMKNALKKTGLFEVLTASKYNTQDAYLLRGDLQVTLTKGHAWIVLENGSKSGAENKPIEPEKEYELGERILKPGMEGEDVKELQEYLNQLGYDAGAVDGEYGDNTEQAVRAFQLDHDCEMDGEAGPETLAALDEALKDTPVNNPRTVRIVNGNCYVRSAPNTAGRQLGVARKGETFPCGGETSADGWNLIEFNGKNGWVSGMYSLLEE